MKESIKTNEIKKDRLFDFFSASIFGVVLGILTSIINQNIRFVSELFIFAITYSLGYWVIFGSIVAINSKTAIKAAINCFCFFLCMNTAFYLFEWAVSGTLQTYHLVRWLINSFLTPVGGYIVFYVKKNNWLSLIGMALPIIFLSAEIILNFQLIIFGQNMIIDGVTSVKHFDIRHNINCLINCLIFLVFIGYLIYLFPKTKKRIFYLFGIVFFGTIIFCVYGDRIINL